MKILVQKGIFLKTQKSSSAIVALRFSLRKMPLTNCSEKLETFKQKRKRSCHERKTLLARRKDHLFYISRNKIFSFKVSTAILNFPQPLFQAIYQLRF